MTPCMMDRSHGHLWWGAAPASLSHRPLLVTQSFGEVDMTVARRHLPL